MKLIQQPDSMDCGASCLISIVSQTSMTRYSASAGLTVMILYLASCSGSHPCRNLINLAAEQIYLVYETPESPAMFDNIPRSQ